MTQQYPAPGSTPPPTLGYAPPPPTAAGARADLHTIASRQRALMLCILAYIGLVIAQFALPPEGRMILGIVALAVSVTAAVFVFMLSLAVYNTAAGIILGILTLIPLIGLFVLLIINGKATGILRKHGVHVGFLGADPKQVPKH